MTIIALFLSSNKHKKASLSSSNYNFHYYSWEKKKSVVVLLLSIFRPIAICIEENDELHSRKVVNYIKHPE